MDNTIQTVYHEYFGRVRIAVINGVYYFVGRDVAQALLFKDTEQAIRQHVQKQDKVVLSHVKTTGQIQNLSGTKIPYNAILINESGLWSLVMRSRLPKAREFQHWLTSEVVPAIMRTGTYTIPAKIAPTSEFTRREKLEILLKLLNLNLPTSLRNQVARQILLVISDECDLIYERIAEEISG